MILSDKTIKKEIAAAHECFSTTDKIPETSGIYMIKSSNNRVYIGQSINLKKRFNQYCKKHFKGQKLLYANCLKYGNSSFLFIILERCDISLLDKKEIYYIDFYKSNYNRYPEHKGLNLSDGGNTNKGYKIIVSEKTKELRRQQAYSKNGIATRVKNNPSLVRGVLNPFYNKKHNDECKKIMGVSKRKPFIATSPDSIVVEFQSVYEFAEKVDCHPSSPNKCLSNKSKLKTVRGWTNFKFIKNDIE